MKKIIIPAFLAMMALPSFAQDEASSNPLDFTVKDITYTILDDEAKTCMTKAGVNYIDYESRKFVTTYGNSTSGDVIIPSSVTKPDSDDVYSVVAIGSYGFNLATSISIPESVVTITTLHSPDVPV